MSAATPWASQFDVLLLDLDGVVYAGGAAIPHAIDSLASALGAGVRLAYVTNNASRPPSAVVAHLGQLGLTAEVDDVVTSAQAGARVLAERLAPESKVLVVGGSGLHEAVQARGFSSVTTAADGPDAVIMGFSPDISWRQLAQATYAVREGAYFVATNTDRTIPTAEGIGPGNGLLVGVVAAAAGAKPVVAGKPETPLMHESVDRTKARHPLVVGDRLDTDIAGANRAGLPSLLVLTGVTGATDFAAAADDERPTYIASDLRALLTGPVEVPSGPDWRGHAARIAVAAAAAVEASQ